MNQSQRLKQKVNLKSHQRLSQKVNQSRKVSLSQKANQSRKANLSQRHRKSQNLLQHQSFLFQTKSRNFCIRFLIWTKMKTGRILEERHLHGREAFILMWMRMKKDVQAIRSMCCHCLNQGK